MRTNLAIQKSPQGYRLVSFLPFKDEEGNDAVEITGCFNQAKVEWYSDISYAISDAKDFIFDPAIWSTSTTMHYQLLGPSQRVECVNDKRPYSMKTLYAYFIKEHINPHREF